MFKVAGKIFAISPLRSKPLRVSVKVEPELGERLRATYPEITPGYHLDKRHWITIECAAGLDDGMIRDLIEDSWAIIVSGLPRAVRAGLAARAR